MDDVRKLGTMQFTGVYGAKYNQFPLGNIWERNITIKMGAGYSLYAYATLYDNKRVT